MVVAEFKNDKFTSVYGLRQWDFGQELLIKGTGIQGKTVEVHFALERDNVALRILGTIENENITVCIPDILLQSGNSIYAYVYKSTDTEGKTTHEIFMHVSPRAKPEDYTEKEFKNALQQVLAIAQSVREEADAGKFNATDEQVKQVVDAYMEENPVAITVDKTLTQSDKAADAKVTGDKFLQYAIKNTVTGESPVAITDSAEEKLQDLKLFGRTEQVTTTGKNLLTNNPKDWNIGLGLSWSGNKGDPINTVNTLESSFIYLNVKSNTKYSFINLKKSKIWVTRIIERNAEEAGLVNHALYKDESMNKEKYTFTTTTETKSIIFQIKNVNTNNAMTETDIKHNEIMFYEGENVQYEPYTGGKPSPSPEYPQEIKNVGKYNELTRKYDVDVKIIGKNLFNLTNNFILGYFNATPNSKIIGYIDNAIVYIPCNPNTTYTVSGCKRKPTNTYRRYKVGETYEFPEVNTEVFNVKEVKLEEHIAFTTSSRAKYLIISAVGDSEVNIEDPMEEVLKRNVSEMMVEISDTPTKYEQYKEQTVKLSLDQPLRGIGEHKDEVTKDGVVRRIKKITLNGSENWVLNNYPNNVKTSRFSIYLGDPYVFYNKKLSICDKLFFSRVEEDVIGILTYSKSLYIKLPKEQFPNVDTLKKYLSENPMTVQYVIEKPITEPLLEDFKQAIESLKACYPTTVITADGGEVDADIEVTYIADTKNYVDRKIKETVSAQMQNAENILSLMPESVQATMIEKDTNKILEREVTR